MFLDDINKINRDINKQLIEKKIQLKKSENINPISETYRLLHVRKTYKDIRNYQTSSSIPVPVFEGLEYGDMNYQNVSLEMNNFESKSEANIAINKLIKNLNSLVRIKAYTGLKSTLESEIFNLLNEKTNAETSMNKIENNLKLTHNRMIKILTEAERISKIHTDETNNNAMNNGELIYTPSMAFFENYNMNVFKIFFQEGHGSVEEKLAQARDINIDDIILNDEKYQSLKQNISTNGKKIIYIEKFINDLDLILDQNYNYKESVNIKTYVSLSSKISIIELISYSILISFIIGSLLGILKNGIKFFE
jgi:hypothetical protein